MNKDSRHDNKVQDSSNTLVFKDNTDFINLVNTYLSLPVSDPNETVPIIMRRLPKVQSPLLSDTSFYDVNSINLEEKKLSQCSNGSSSNSSSSDLKGTTAQYSKDDIYPSPLSSSSSSPPLPALLSRLEQSKTIQSDVSQLTALTNRDQTQPTDSILNIDNTILNILKPMIIDETYNIQKSKPPKPFICTFQGCGQKFVSRYRLKSHSVTHSIKQYYFCKVCFCRFKRKHDLNRHIKVQHGKSFYEVEDCFGYLEE